MTKTAKERVIKSAMRLYKHWVSLRPHSMIIEPRTNHWYPLCSETEAKALCRACKALEKEGK